MSRTTILGGVRRALKVEGRSDVRREAVAARLAGAGAHPLPARCIGTDAELMARFSAFLGAQGTDLIAVADRAKLPAAIVGYLRERNLPLRLRLGADPYLVDLPWGEVPELERESGPAQPDDTAGLSRAIAGVAETGTLVLASGPQNPVTLAFVPDTHLIVVEAGAIVGSYEAACARLGTTALPRTLNLVSGASRTGDIGGRIVMGAHGPRRLAVFLVG